MAEVFGFGAAAAQGLSGGARGEDDSSGGTRGAKPPVGAEPSAGMDRISIVGLRVRGRHGVLPQERADGQEFVVDAVLWLDTRAAASADSLRLTADYGQVAARLADIVAGEPVALIETLAARLAAECLTDQVVQAADVTVHKPQAPVGQQVADIAVTIRRNRT
jgi:dihydroneopterin aldolase